jgi:hypothetical protein
MAVCTNETDTPRRRGQRQWNSQASDTGACSKWNILSAEPNGGGRARLPALGLFWQQRSADAVFKDPDLFAVASRAGQNSTLQQIEDLAFLAPEEFADLLNTQNHGSRLLAQIPELLQGA